MIALIALLSTTSFAVEGTLDRIVAVVNGDIVSLTEVYDIGGSFISERCPAKAEKCVRDMELQIIDELIKNSLVNKELKRLGMAIGKTEVDQAIDRTVAENKLPDRAALRDLLEKQGTPWSEYRDEIRKFIRIQTFQGRVLAPSVSVNEDEVRDLYQRTARREMKEMAIIDGFGIPIPPDATEDTLIKMQAEAEALVKQIQKSAIPWEEAVKDYDGANLAVAFAGQKFKKGQLQGPLDTAAFSAEVGEVTGPINNGSVLIIVRVKERGKMAADVAKFEDVKDQLREQVFSSKLAVAEEEWYRRARREAQVEIKL